METLSRLESSQGSRVSRTILPSLGRFTNKPKAYTKLSHRRSQNWSLKLSFAAYASIKQPRLVRPKAPSQVLRQEHSNARGSTLKAKSRAHTKKTPVYTSFSLVTFHPCQSLAHAYSCHSWRITRVVILP